MKRFKIFATVLTFIALFSLSCGKAGEPTIHVAVIGPMKHSIGINISNGVKLSMEEIMKKGGITVKKDGNPVKHKIKLHYIDDKFASVAAASKALNQQIEKTGIDLIVGGFSSKVVVPLMEIMAAKKIIWLGTGGASPAVVGKVKKNYNKYKYYFRIGTIDATRQGKGIADFAIDVLKPKGLTKAAFLGINHAFAKFQLKDAQKHMKAAGFEVVVEEFVNPKNVDFTPILKKIEKNADFIVVSFLSSEEDVFIKQVHAMGLNKRMPIFGSFAGLSSEKVKEYEDMIYGYTSVNLQSGEVDMTGEGGAPRFVKAYQKRYGKNPAGIAYVSYDCLHIYKKAVEKANSLKADDLIKTMEAPDFEYVGISRFKWHKENHDHWFGYHQGKNYVDFVWMQFHENGEYYCVYPENFRQKKYFVPGKKKS